MKNPFTNKDLLLKEEKERIAKQQELELRRQAIHEYVNSKSVTIIQVALLSLIVLASLVVIAIKIWG